MIFIGDVHAKLGAYNKIITQYNKKYTVQLGNFGFGFNYFIEDSWNSKHMFIRGNHDCPEECRAHPNYLGDWGISTWADLNFFFVGGAYSIDYKWRCEYEQKYYTKIWWEEEEIAKKEHSKIIKLYSDYRPYLMVTHDCPPKVREAIIGKDKEEFKNRTSDILLKKLFKLYKPRTWIFGHYHTSFNKIIDGCNFICLNELETKEIRSY